MLLLFMFCIGWLAWVAWKPPQTFAPIAPLAQVLPEKPGDASVLWRVVSRRMIVPKAAEVMQKTLVERGLPVIAFKRMEQVELHAFDDPRIFVKRETAVKARQAWHKAGFEAELVKPKGGFGVALGRFYLGAYARELQQRLDKEKRAYTYQLRKPLIPTWRFTFPAAPYDEAKSLWLKVQQTGVADPVLIRESRFRKMFGDAAS